MIKHYFSYFNDSFKSQWDQPAITDYDGDCNYTYGQVAQKVALFGALFEKLGLKAGDKMAICGRNSANWVISYLAIAAYKGVIVSVLQDFKAEDIHGLVNHSDAKILFVGPYVWKNLKAEAMPNLQIIISIEDFSILYAKDPSVLAIANQREELFRQKYPNGFRKEDLNFPTDNLEDLALINYTSGSTGAPKGVMLSYKSLSSNVEAAMLVLPNKPREEEVSMLPLAHMYGQLGDFLYQLASGCHVYYLRRSPTPSILLQAFQAVHPYMIITVPMVIEKIYKKSLAPFVNRPLVKKLWRNPFCGPSIRKIVKNKLMKAFGGNIRYFLCGGAALNPEVESCLMDIHFPLSVGYGLTECGPLVSGSKPKKFVARSGGRILPNMEAKVVPLEDGNSEVGEIYVRGAHVMMGYYKNEEATQAVMTEDGWMRTGDLGVINQYNYIFLRGRNKNMILGASGQNIYPEEIEDKLNNLAGVAESLVVERSGRLYALVFPDYAANKNADKSILEMMRENLKKLNDMLPSFSKVSDIEVMEHEFEKTPKKSIKRFLYK